MYISIIAVVIGLVVLFFQYKRYQHDNQLYKELKNDNYTKVFYNKTLLLFYVFFTIYSIAVVGLSLTSADYELFALGLVLIFFATGEYINLRSTFYIYYNDTNLVIKSEKIKFRNIQSITLIKKNKIEIKTSTGKTIQFNSTLSEVFTTHTTLKIKSKLPTKK